METKVRVWNREINSYEYFIDEVRNDIVLTLPNCIPTKVEEVYCDAGNYLNTSDVNNNYIIEHYTGKLDIKDKEIYEGCIIKNSQGEIAPVIYHTTLCGFTILFDSYGIDLSIGMFKDLEIIGDIHTNGDLLK